MIRYEIRFYSLALIYLIFDLELVILLPVSLEIVLSSAYKLYIGQIIFTFISLDLLIELYNEIIYWPTSSPLIGSIKTL